MKNLIKTIIRITLIMGILLSFTGGNQNSVNAFPVETCTWEGTISSTWHNPLNWDCGIIPTLFDDVVIPPVTTNPELDKLGVANSITIQDGGQLTIGAGVFTGVTAYSIIIETGGQLNIDTLAVDAEVTADSIEIYGQLNIDAGAEVTANSILIDTAGQLNIDGGMKIDILANSFINNGTITIVKELLTINKLSIGGGSFDNNGEVTGGGILILEGAGTHTGTFSCDTLIFSLTLVRQQNTFESESSIVADKIWVLGNHDVYISGSIEVASELLISQASNVTISTFGDLNSVLLIPDIVTVEDTSQLTYYVDIDKTLYGEGTIEANLTNAGTVSLGDDSPGIITIVGDYTQEIDGSLNLKLGGTEGTQYDQLEVSGSATLGGTLNVTFFDGFTPSAGDSFTLLTCGSHTGTFSTLILPELALGLGWYIDYHFEFFVVLRVVEVGSISGTVFYDGSLPLSKIEVNAFLDPDGSPTKKGVIVEVGADYITYVINDLTPGEYYVSAFVDIDGDGGPPLPDEPVGWYDNDADGIPDPVTVVGGETTPNIDITLEDSLEDSYLQIYIPLVVR